METILLRFLLPHPESPLGSPEINWLRSFITPLRLRQHYLQRGFQFFQRGESFESLADPAFIAQYQGPRLIEPIGKVTDSPILNKLRQGSLVKVSLNLVGIVVDLNVDKVGFTRMFYFKFEQSGGLGPAGWAGAKGR